MGGPVRGAVSGEYVLEIIEAIGRGLPGLAVPGSAQRRVYGEFIALNPAFFARTERRVVSYWSCYYRWKYGAFGVYPGCDLLKRSGPLWWNRWARSGRGTRRTPLADAGEEPA